MMIERIRREHGYTVRLLAILNRKLHLLEKEQPINYSIVKEIVDYSQIQVRSATLRHLSSHAHFLEYDGWLLKS